MTKERFELIAKILMCVTERIQVVSLESEVDQFWEDYETVKKLIDDQSYYQDVVVHTALDIEHLINPKRPTFFTSSNAWQIFRDRVQNGLDMTNQEADKLQKRYLTEKSLAKQLSDILEVTA
jgi:hypothetical protein